MVVIFICSLKKKFNPRLCIHSPVFSSRSVSFKFRPNIHFELSVVYNTRQEKLFVVSLDFYYFKERFPICIIIKCFSDIKKNFWGCCALLSWASLVAHLVKNVFWILRKIFWGRSD